MSQIVKSPLKSRVELATLLNDRELLGYAAEIGVHRGEFAAAFLERWKGCKLYCVDPYIVGYSNRDPIALQQFRFEDEEAASTALKKYHERVAFLVMISVRAADIIHRPLDFVYIDGNHESPYPAEDLKIWWPKIHSGGILAGHDFSCSDPGYPWTNTVRPAVEAFAVEHGLNINVINEIDESPSSFYLVKP